MTQIMYQDENYLMDAMDKATCSETCHLSCQIVNYRRQ